MVGEPTLQSGRHIKIDSGASNLAEPVLIVYVIARLEPIMKLVTASSGP